MWSLLRYEYESEVHPCSDKPHIGLHKKKRSQQAKENDRSPLWSTSEATSGVPCPVLDPLVQEMYWQTGPSPAKDH